MILHHYTKLDVLFHIVQSEHLEIRGTYFERFNNDDYMWVRKNSEGVVKRICEELKLPYDPDYLSCKPYIISFCKNPDSEHMWEQYGDHHKGVKLVFDQQKMEPVLNSNNDGDGFVPCIYIDDNSEEEIKIQIVDLLYSGLLTQYDEDDRMVFLATGIKRKKDFKSEEEIRYVNVFRDVFKWSVSNGEPYFEDIEVDKTNWYRFYKFPHDALIQVVVGRDVSEEDYLKAKEHIVKCGYDPKIVCRH